MSVLNLNFESHFLRGNASVTILLPDRPHEADPASFYGNAARYRTLLLLHGTYGDHTDWLRKTNIEVYASEGNWIVVMPSGLNTYFCNCPGFGPGYYVEDYLMRELLPLVRGWLPASERREETFVAGLSMGAVSALRLLTTYPETFGGGILLSAFPQSAEACRLDAEHALGQDYAKLEQEARGCPTPFDPAFRNFRIANNVQNAGGIPNYVRQNSWDAVSDFAGQENAPRLYFACGTEDPNYEKFKRLRAHADAIGLTADFVEEPGFGHEWRFWDKYIEKGLKGMGM